MGAYCGVVPGAQGSQHEGSRHVPDGLARHAARRVRRTAVGAGAGARHALVAHVVTPSSERRIASRPSRMRLFTVPSGVSVLSGDLLLRQSAEVGELDRLTLDIGERPDGRSDGVGDRVRPTPPPRHRAA